MLASGYYEDIAERMVGDIDILVANDQLHSAFELLKEHSYKPTAEPTFCSKYFTHKHLPRMASDKALSAVELHRKLFMSYTTPLLANDAILSKKTVAHNIFIPAPIHIEYHSVLNHQINDHGYYYNAFHFRTAYDSLILLKRGDLTKTSPYLNKEIDDHYQKMSVLFEDYIHVKTSKPSYRTRLFLLKLKWSLFYKLGLKYLYLWQTMKVLLNRFDLFLSNRQYREDLLHDRQRVIKTLKSKF